MKFSATLASLAVAPCAQAFPAIAQMAAESIAERNNIETRQFPGAVPPFDAKSQYVSNQGKYAFNPPSGNDQRGPCPGLNAMANHGYFPHNGVGNLADFTEGCFKAFGMGLDLGGFLAVYGAIFDGDLTKYSIGGPSEAVINLGALVGQPRGLSGSHNKYEGDVSPVRGDLYVYGNDYLNQVKQFRELYALGVANGNKIDLPLLTQYRVTRFQQSISENPYFFNAPFSGVIASPAAWTFIYRFMANHSAEYPEGLLDLETLKSFYSMTGDYPDFTYTPGHEKFPDNWYRRNDIDAYTIPYFLLDAVKMAVEHPQFASLGGNTGKVNSFVGLEPANLTDGVINAGNLLEGNNLFCYALALDNQQAPDILAGLFTDTSEAENMLTAAIAKFTQGLGCPQLNNIDMDQFKKYPGYTNIKSDGTY